MTPEPTGTDGHQRLRVLLPTDLASDSGLAFANALRITVAARGHLAALHVMLPGRPPDWSSIPRATQLLRRWRLVPEDATSADIDALGFGLDLESSLGESPVKRIVAESNLTGADLVVLRAHSRQDRVARMLQPSISEKVARSVSAHCLVLPDCGRSFVDVETGKIHLSRVFVGAAGDPSDQRLVSAAVWIAQLLGVQQVNGVLFHVGAKHDIEELDVSRPGWIWEVETGSGAVVPALRQAISAHEPDLVVMGTRGRDSLGDVLMGSHLEQILHTSQCPVLVVPLGHAG